MFLPPTQKIESNSYKICIVFPWHIALSHFPIILCLLLCRLYSSDFSLSFKYSIHFSAFRILLKLCSPFGNPSPFPFPPFLFTPCSLLFPWHTDTHAGTSTCFPVWMWGLLYDAFQSCQLEGITPNLASQGPLFTLLLLTVRSVDLQQWQPPSVDCKCRHLSLALELENVNLHYTLIRRASLCALLFEKYFLRAGFQLCLSLDCFCVSGF